ncbi:MAG: hypothetical protein K0S32_3240 [Bacteroidetes bacterium]|jgi:hypothetical protein|nr:hypothetical protein [Bacteroidota bacterium]
MKKILLFLVTLFGCTCCNQVDNPDKYRQVSEKEPCCKDKCGSKKTSAAFTPTTELSCKLTSPELQKRKETVIEDLRKQVLGKKELTNGYAFKFKGNDETIDQLITFIKAERQCCDFFTFNLSVNGNPDELWLEITGAEGAKDFIKTELEL